MTIFSGRRIHRMSTNNTNQPSGLTYLKDVDRWFLSRVSGMSSLDVSSIRVAGINSALVELMMARTGAEHYAEAVRSGRVSPEQAAADFESLAKDIQNVRSTLLLALELGYHQSSPDKFQNIVHEAEEASA